MILQIIKFIKSKKNILTPLGFILGTWLIFSSAYFLKGDIPYPSTYQVNHFKPWSHYQEYWGPVKNGAMPDIISQIYPWRHFTIEQWKEGNIPKWNPNTFAGTPHIGNVQSAVFSPLNFLFIILPFVDAWSLMILFQPLLAGISMYLYLNSQKKTLGASLLGSVSFMFCGFITVWMAYGTLSMAISVLPLAFYAIVKSFEKKQLRYYLLLSTTVAISIFAGHFQTSLYFILLGFLYLIFLSFSTKQFLQGLKVAFFLIIGLLIALPQLLPAIQLYNLSPRSSIFLYSGGIPLNYLITIIAPDFFGNPVTRNDWVGSYAEWASFVGIVPVLMSLYSLMHIRKKEVMFFWIVSIFALVLAVDSPLLKAIGSLKIPVLSTSTPSRIIVLLSFSLSVLSAFGFDFFVKLLFDLRSKKIFIPQVLLSIVLLIAWGIIATSNIVDSDKSIIAKKNLFLTTFIFFTVVCLTGIYYYFSKKIHQKSKAFIRITKSLVIILILTLGTFDSLRFAIKWMPFESRNLVFPDINVIRVLQENIGDGRVFGNLGAHVSTYYNIPELEGYDPLFSRRYAEFIQASVDGHPRDVERSVVNIARDGKFTKRVLNLLGVNIIFHSNSDTNQSWSFPVWKDSSYEKFYNDEHFTLYKNTSVIQRPSIFTNYEVVKDDVMILDRFYEDNFDYRKILILEKEPGIKSWDYDSKKDTKSLKVIKNTPTEIVIKAEVSKPSLLFLADTFYPGWIAFVNNEEAEIFRANYAFRAVVIPEGDSVVRFKY